MGWSESTISDLRDLTLATGFTFQNVEENLLFVYVKEGVKVCCTYSKPRVKKKSYFLELSKYFLFLVGGNSKFGLSESTFSKTWQKTFLKSGLK